VDLRLLFLDAKKRYSDSGASPRRAGAILSIRHAHARGGAYARARGPRTRGRDRYRLDTTDLLPNTLRQLDQGMARIRHRNDDLLFESLATSRAFPGRGSVFERALSAQSALRSALATPDRSRRGKSSRSREDRRSARCWGYPRFVQTWLPAYAGERSSLTVAVGCTGGRHRSVYLVERLGAYFRSHTPVLVFVIGTRRSA